MGANLEDILVEKLLKRDMGSIVLSSVEALLIKVRETQPGMVALPLSLILRLLTTLLKRKYVHGMVILVHCVVNLVTKYIILIILKSTQ